MSKPEVVRKRKRGLSREDREAKAILELGRRLKLDRLRREAHLVAKPC